MENCFLLAIPSEPIPGPPFLMVSPLLMMPLSCDELLSVTEDVEVQRMGRLVDRPPEETRRCCLLQKTVIQCRFQATMTKIGEKNLLMREDNKGERERERNREKETYLCNHDVP
jgi:hypothetical protein